MSDIKLRTKILLFRIIFFGTWVFYYCSYIFTNVLWFMVTYTPDSLIVYKIPFFKCKTDEIDIIEAKLIKKKQNK